MKKIILAGHGNFASGLYSSLKIILGEKKCISILDCYTEDNQDVKRDIRNLLDSFDEEDELICLTDILGGSVNNEFMKQVNDKKTKVITGTNLSLLLNIVLNMESNLEDELEVIIKESRQGILSCILNNIEKKIIDDEEF